MKIYTLGFTKKSAGTFFGLIKDNNVRTIVDVRVNNASQLAGFAKKDDLKFFLQEICSTGYVHLPDLAPTKEMLSAYRKGAIGWEKYEEQFLSLLARRNVERSISNALFEGACLLCSEHEPHYCHRRLVVEYLNNNKGLNLEVKHLY